MGLSEENIKSGVLYLIPVGMSDAPYVDVLPSGNMAIVRELRHFIVENVRNARRFLKRCDPSIDINQLTFHELNRHTDLEEVSEMIAPLGRGENVGVMSDAGCPAIADPGAIAVAAAQRKGYRVHPLVGPSSILMALMASGFNGQGFTFHGYLPIPQADRTETLKRLEAESRRYDRTQIFIETPYRNASMLELLVAVLSPQSLLCVACDITDPLRETILTRTVAQWRGMMERGDIENYDKRPAIFLLYAGADQRVHQGKEKPGGRSKPKHR